MSPGHDTPGQTAEGIGRPHGEPIRVCQLIKGLGRGGAESLLPQMVRSAGPGFRHSVGYFLPWKNALATDLEERGVGVRCFGSRSNAAILRAVPAVARWLGEERADLLHAHLPMAGVAGRLAARLADVPVVYTEHNLQQRYHHLTRLAARLTWRLQERVVAVSGEVADSALAVHGQGVPVTVVRNGIEIPPRPDPAAVARLRAELGLAADAEVVGTVAVMRVQKRLDLWLDAAARLAARHPACRFLLVGDGPERATLESRAAEDDLAGRVVFAGLQEDVTPYLAAMDVFMMSSRFEGLPLALLEAMAAGRPVVATPVGGVGEVVDDGVHALLVPFAEDDAFPRALAAAAERLLAEPDLAGELTGRARERVEERFGIGRMNAELETIYRQVLAESGARR